MKFTYAILLLLTGCSMLGQSYGDGDLTNYKNLTDLKPEVSMLYETFLQDSPDHEMIWSIRLKLAQAYEYEKGKGEKYRQRAQLIQNIREQFEKDIEQRKGPWTSEQITSKTKSMEGLFDRAIRAQREGEEGQK